MPSDAEGTERSSVRIVQLGAPALPEQPSPAGPKARRRSRVLAVVALLCFAGAAYTATAGTVSGPIPSAMYGMSEMSGMSVQPASGGPLDVCSVHPRACPSPPAQDAQDAQDAPPVPDARVRFLPDELTRTTGSMIVCEAETGGCRPVAEGPTACEVVDALKAGLGRLPQEFSDIRLPDGQDSLVVVEPGGVVRAVGITYADGTVAVCGPLEIPYTDGGEASMQGIPADGDVGALRSGESYAYRFDGSGRLDLVGVRSMDGTVRPVGGD